MPPPAVPPRPPDPDPPEIRGVEQDMHVAYELIVQDLQGNPIERLEPVNVNVATLLLTVLGALPRIAPHRPVLEQLPTFDVAQLDDLELCAYALAGAHSLRKGAAEPSNHVAELARLQKETRDLLQSDARALVKRGLLDGKRVAKLDSGTSHLALAFDVVALVSLFLQNWNAIDGKCGITLPELEKARKQASQLVAAIGRRQQTAEEDDPDDIVYRQIFTRLTRAYTDVRKALSFIRRKEGDANRIAPSAYRGRPKRAPKAPAHPPAIPRPPEHI